MEQVPQWLMAAVAAAGMTAYAEDLGDDPDKNGALTDVSALQPDTPGSVH